MALDRTETDQFLHQALMSLTGASNAGLKAELFDVLKEFLEDSNSWTEDIEFQAVAGSQDYLLTPREDGQIIRLVGVWDNKGIPIPAFMPIFGTVRLVQPINSTPASKWFARVVKNVVLPTTRDDIPIVPSWLFRVYSIHLLDGIKGKMMAQPQKSYSNSTLSTYHLRRFRTGIQIARAAAERQNIVGGQTWAYPQAGHVGSQRGGVSTAWPTRAF